MAPWCYDGEHARSLLSDSKLVKTVFEINVGKDGIVGYAIYVESDIREWTMVGNDVLIYYSEVTAETNIWRSGFGSDSYVGCDW